MKVELQYPSVSKTGSLPSERAIAGATTVYILSKEEVDKLNEDGEVTCYDEGEKSGGRRIIHSPIVLRRE